MDLGSGDPSSGDPSSGSGAGAPFSPPLPPLPFAPPLPPTPFFPPPMPPLAPPDIAILYSGLGALGVMMLIIGSLAACRMSHHPPQNYFLCMAIIIALCWVYIVVTYNASNSNTPILLVIIAFWTNLVTWLPCCIIYLRQRQIWHRRLAAIEGDLPALLGDGTIRLVRVAWLLSRPADYILKRRQELPEEAFVPISQAKKLLRARKVAVLSYRWLTAAHPDPEGFHIGAVRAFFAKHKGRSALFWDFASCYQKERTEVQDELFKKGLKWMTCLYASPQTLVVQHKQLPNGEDPSFTALVPTFPKEIDGMADYHHSGWCTMEQHAASLATEDGGKLYTISHGKVRISASVRLSPAEMKAIFADENRTRFLGKADRELVGNMYATFHANMDAFDAVNESPVTTCHEKIANATCLALNGKGAIPTAMVLLWIGIFAGIPLFSAEGRPVGVRLFGVAFVPIVATVIFGCCCSFSPSIERLVRAEVQKSVCCSRRVAEVAPLYVV